MTKHILRMAMMAMITFSTVTLTGCGGDEDDPENIPPTEAVTPPDEEESPDAPEEPEQPLPDIEINIPEFAKGADVSWLTKLEAEGVKFYTTEGEEMELMTLLHDCYDMNAIRLRVWVNPADGYNNIADVTAKAVRAKALGMALMIDFHFSDTWADPANQTVPAAWKGLAPAAMADAVKNHVTEMLTALIDKNIAPEWVQIGNETSQGMLFESGKMSGQNAGEFPRYLNAGYEAVKALLPDTQVIVHLPNGYDSGLYTWFFDLVEKNGGKYDLIGMSLYPESTTWPMETLEGQVDDCISNIKMLSERYGKDVMLCEIGFHYDRGAEGYRVIRKIIDSNDLPGKLKGIFYWEPEAPEHYNGGYDKGCFTEGRPNRTLDAFKSTR